MAFDIYMPQLGLTMTEGTVLRWLKAPGDVVSKGEPVVEIETDKITAEIESPAEGVVGPILVADGEVAPIGGILGHVLAPGEAAPTGEPATVAAVPKAVPAAGPAGAIPVSAPADLPGPVSRVFASPRARRLADQLQVDLAAVEASGPAGRIVEADVRWYADQRRPAAAPATPVAQRLAQKLGVDLRAVHGSGPGGQIVKEDVERAAARRLPEPVQVPVAPAAAVPVPAAPPLPGDVEPLRGVRRVVAERMAHSFSTAPHFYLTAEVEAAALIRMREGLLGKVETATGVRLTVTDILVQVCAQALHEFPAANATWDEAAGGVRRQSTVNVGLAVALEDGLVVPVLHEADQLTLSEIARRRTDLVARAQQGKLGLADVEGGTFTLTNLGMFGVDQFQAILNPTQAAILAVGRVRERPVAYEGAVVVRPTVYLTLSVDHRLLDGAQAARFLERIAQYIEEPYLLLA